MLFSNFLHTLLYEDNYLIFIYHCRKLTISSGIRSSEQAYLPLMLVTYVLILLK